MKHRKCNGSIIMDLSGLYVINSPSITISTKGITPGMIQIDSPTKKEAPKLICKECNKIFVTKRDFEEEIIETCGVCGHEYDPSQIHITDYISRVCNDCINNKSNTKIVSSMQKNILALYGEVIRKQENPTLLTILMKKL